MGEPIYPVSFQWDAAAFGHSRQSENLWAAAFTCPDGKEQDRLMELATKEERAAKKCRENAAKVRQAYRYQRAW
jgi:hypothetical protein